MRHRASRHVAGALVLAGVLGACESGVGVAGGGGDSAPVERDDAIARSRARERAIAFLVEAATTGQPEERVNAMEALTAVPARLEPIARAATTHENAGVRAGAAMVMLRAKLCGSAAIVEPLTRDSSPYVRAAALGALARCGRPADLTELGLMLGDGSARVRAHAAFVLGEIGDKSAVGLLRDAASDTMLGLSQAEAKFVLLQIAEARVKLADQDGLYEIRSALYPGRSEDLEPAALAAQIIGQVGDRAWASQLANLLKERDDAGKPMPAEVRLAAAGALARMGHGGAARVALEYVTEQSATVRAQAAYVLGESGDPAHVERLEGMMRDRSVLVRISAAAGVLRISESPKGGNGGG